MRTLADLDRASESMRRALAQGVMALDEVAGGSTVVTPDGARIGTVTDLLVGPSGWIDKVVLDAGSALGAGSRHVTLEIDRLRRTEAGAGTLMPEASVAELKALPAYRQVDNRWELIP